VAGRAQIVDHQTDESEPQFPKIKDKRAYKPKHTFDFSIRRFGIVRGYLFSTYALGRGTLISPTRRLVFPEELKAYQQIGKPRAELIVDQFTQILTQAAPIPFCPTNRSNPAAILRTTNPGSPSKVPLSQDTQSFGVGDTGGRGSDKPCCYIEIVEFP
jgi:hypothetical protein